jgi:eukaryotic-like serine/threonine-protein kinase
MSTEQLFAGRYELEDRLGVGGMSTVQRAFDTRLERHVAVKLLAEHLAADGAFVARFRREALAAARLIHPNVVQVYDFGTDETSSRQYIVMEYVAGESCAEILRERGHVAPDEAVDILAQACRGLDYAHRNGVVHRDVKPGNLLRNQDGVIKLADFGIAKAADDSDITKVGSVVGTAAYLAPEQARGEPAGPASDIYALGVVAYQLVAGRLPYEGSSLTELARQQEVGPPERLDRLVDGVPAALAEAVQRALSSLPEARYASAIEMESALRDGLAGVAPAAGTAGWDPGEDPTHRLEPTAATTAMPATASAPVRRPLEPLAEEPRRASAARRAEAPPPARRRGRRGTWIALLIAVLLAALAGYFVVSTLDQVRQIELREQVEGRFDEAMDDLRGLIRDNTR